MFWASPSNIDFGMAISNLDQKMHPLKLMALDPDELALQQTVSVDKIGDGNLAGQQWQRSFIMVMRHVRAALALRKAGAREIGILHCGASQILQPYRSSTRLIRQTTNACIIFAADNTLPNDQSFRL